MTPRFFTLLERADSFGPKVSCALAGARLRVASPFHAPLHASVETWKAHVCRIRVRKRRALRNPLGGAHAGSLVPSARNLVQDGKDLGFGLRAPDPRQGLIRALRTGV